MNCFCDHKNCLLQVPIFNHLDNKYLNEILPLLKSKHYKKNQEVFNPYDNISNLYIIQSGFVKVYKLTEDGKEQVLRFLGPGDFLGELNIFTQQNYDTFAVALDDCDICYIERSDFETVLKTHPNISIEILKELTERLNNAEDKLTKVSLSVEERLMNYFNTLIDPTKDENIVKIPMKKKDLASYLSISPETLSRALKKLEETQQITTISNSEILIK